MEKFYTILIDDITAKTTVYQYLRKNGYSEHYLSNLRTPGKILVNSAEATMRTQLKNGDTLAIDKNPYKKTEIALSAKPIEIVYEDDNYLVCNKPAGLASTPTRSHYDDNLSARICYYMQQKDDTFTLRVMNRLDLDVSGLVLVAKDAITYQATSNIKKEYYAVCNGIIDKETVVEQPIYTENIDGINTMKRTCSPLGQYAKTTFSPINHKNNQTLLKVSIEKGRTHQIRVHAAYINHPLVGDKLYGSDDGIDRILLHLKKLSFYNKISDKQYDIEVPLPKTFEK